MDDKIRRAEELLEQRARERGGNGHANVDTDAPASEQPPIPWKTCGVMSSLDR